MSSACKAPVTDVAHDAYYLNRTVAQCRNPENLSNRIFPGEGMTCHVLIDHHNLRVHEFVVVVEESATKQRKPHDLQIIRSDGRRQRLRFLTRRCRGCRCPVRNNILTLAHGNDIGERDRLNGGCAPHALHEFRPSRSRLRRIRKNYRGIKSYARR